MLKKQDITQHPCYFYEFGTSSGLSHRSGGFGSTCERCGTEIEGPNNKPINGCLSWTPVSRPKPYQEGSLDRAVYEVTHSITITDAVIEILSR